mgnify:CR=1 FL=1
MTLEFDLNGLDTEQVGRLMEVLARSDVEECEIQQGDRRLRVRRVVSAPPPQNQPAPAFIASESAEAEGPRVVQASAVGFFRRSEGRSGPPKIEVGAPVKVGDVLGFVEVMNIPHSVLSTCEGVVESFLVEDGQPVEYGQPLVAISR